MSGGFGAGFVKGLLVSLIGAAALSLATPLSPLDPGAKMQVDLSTPAASGFNAERKDKNPVLPNTDQSVVTEDIQKPQVSDATGSTPVADTSPASRPTASDGVELPAVDFGNQAAAIATPGPESSPVTSGVTSPVALGVPMPQIDNPVAEIPVDRVAEIKAPATEVKAPPAVDETGSLQQKTVPTAAAPTETTAPVAPVAPASDSALIRNRVAFQNPEGKPLFSIILIDVGDAGLGADVLATFDFPVTFAISPESKGATATAKNLAHNGFEILALAPQKDGRLTKDQSPEAVDSTLGKVFATLPEAVGLIDATTAEIQQNPVLSDEVIAALKKTGHGFLSYNIGLNTTDHKAARQGLKSAVVYRVLDSERESGTVIKRYLDRAALQARKTGQVVVVGRAYPETVTALFSWALSSKSARVVLAPVSAALLARR